MSPEQVEALRNLMGKLMRDPAQGRARQHRARAPDPQPRLHGEVPPGDAHRRRASTTSARTRSQRMREVVNRLAQRIKNILSIRRKRLKRGKLDLHQTLRRNMASGGVPFEVIYKQRRKERPKLVIMCDVSSSVANVSRFMLQFMSTSCRRPSRKIRSFVFVAELGEVTQVFKDYDVKHRRGARRSMGARSSTSTPARISASSLPRVLEELTSRPWTTANDGPDPGRRAQQLQRRQAPGACGTSTTRPRTWSGSIPRVPARGASEIA